jgi:hypothetical protein
MDAYQPFLSYQERYDLAAAELDEDLTRAAYPESEVLAEEQKPELYQLNEFLDALGIDDER